MMRLLELIIYGVFDVQLCFHCQYSRCAMFMLACTIQKDISRSLLYVVLAMWWHKLILCILVLFHIAMLVC